MLTACHYADAVRHGLSLALISDTSQLESIEAKTAAYQGMGLVNVAQTTRQRFLALAEEFIDRNEWPPGTDEFSPYLFALRSSTHTLAYPFFPDITGGSFRDHDDDARSALGSAAAAIVLVDPARYQLRTVDAKRYREAILERIQAFAAKNVPTCVMLTKADVLRGETVDAAQTQLAAVLGQQPEEFQYALCRISVVSDTTTLDEGDPPPPSDQRNPDLLIRAFIWTLTKAVLNPHHTTGTTVNMRPAPRTAPLITERVPELRPLQSYNISGVALCAGEGPGVQAYLIRDDRLCHVAFGNDGQFKEQSAPGVLEEFEDVQAWQRAGEIVLGERCNPQTLWVGNVSVGLVKTALPFELARWIAISTRLVAAVDIQGRVHLLSRDRDSWRQRANVNDAVGPSKNVVVGYAEKPETVVVSNGAETIGLRVQKDDFGERSRTNSNGTFDTSHSQISRLGLLAAQTTKGKLIVGGTASSIEIGDILPSDRDSFAMAPLLPLVGFVGPQRQVRAAWLTNPSRNTTSDKGPLLDSAPTSMVWVGDQRSLLVIAEDGGTTLYRAMGLE